MGIGKRVVKEEKMGEKVKIQDVRVSGMLKKGKI